MSKDKEREQREREMREKQLERIVSSREDKLSEGAKLAIMLCSSAFHYGGAWGFLRSTKENFRECIEEFRKEHQNVRLFKVSNGALIHANENFLANAVNALLPGAITQDFAQKAIKRRQAETERFIKFVQNVLDGKEQVTKKNGIYELQLGVYSINETNSIRLNGVEYPAYKLTLFEALDIIDKLSKQQNLVSEVYAVTEDNQRVFAPVFAAMTNSKGVQAVYRGLSISETDTGVFVTVHLRRK